MSRPSSSRASRVWYVIALALGVLLAALPAGAAAPAKNVILMIADGQGFNAVKSAQYYRGSAAAYQGFPVQYGVTTYSADGSGYDPAQAWTNFNYVTTGATDSASAATAIMAGVKTHDGTIGVDVSGNPVTSIAQIAAGLGKATGAVSTVPFSHATPAAVAAHNIARDNYSALANEMIYNTDLDVIMGGGNPLYDDNGDLAATPNYSYVGGQSTWNALTAGTTGQGWTLVQDKASFEQIANGQQAAPQRLIGLPQIATTLQQKRTRATDPGSTNPSQVPYNPNVPTLSVMSQAALRVLNQDPDGFFVMIEGGAVDWAEHSNQKSRLVEEQLDFDAAVAAVEAWVQANSSWQDTLLIITADHETGHLWGPNSGLPATFNPLTDSGVGVVPGMKYSSTGHTNSLVPLFAKGAGADLFAVRVDGTDSVRGAYIDNTDIFGVMDTAITPEPASTALLLGGLLALVRRRGRR